MRTVKAPDVRRAEIIQAAHRLFQSRGYSVTSVDEIVREAQVAKGTFYYYFKSKADILEALARQMVTDMAEQAQVIADDPSLPAITKICRIISQQNQVKDDGGDVMEGMHEAVNRELHDRINVETVLTLGPVFAQVIEQGNREGVFQVDDPLSTIQFILAGADFLMGENVFNWTPDEQVARLRAMLILIERALGAAPDTLAPILGQHLMGAPPS